MFEPHFVKLDKQVGTYPVFPCAHTGLFLNLLNIIIGFEILRLL